MNITIVTYVYVTNLVVERSYVDNCANNAMPVRKTCDSHEGTSGKIKGSCIKLTKIIEIDPQIVK